MRRALIYLFWWVEWVEWVEIHIVDVQSIQRIKSSVSLTAQLYYSIYFYTRRSLLQITKITDISLLAYNAIARQSNTASDFHGQMIISVVQLMEVTMRQELYYAESVIKTPA